MRDRSWGLVRSAFPACGVAAVIAVLILSSRVEAFDKDGKPGKKQEARDNERVRDARKRLEDARANLRDAERDRDGADKELRAAETAEKAALRAGDAARETAESRIGEREGLPKLQAKLKEAQLAFDKAKAPLIASLHATPEYQSAAQEAEAALTRLKGLRDTGDRDDAARKQLVGELNRTALRPAQLESKAIESDGALRNSRDRLAALQDAVGECVRKVRRQVESDRDVKTALETLESARSQLKSARADAELRRRNVVQAGRDVAEKAARLQQAQIADRKNDGKPKGKGKP